MSSLADLKAHANSLKSLNKDPVNNAADIVRILDLLLDGHPTSKDVLESRIKLQIKVTSKKTKNGVVSSKAEALNSKYDNLDSAVPSQTISRTSSQDVGQSQRAKFEKLFMNKLVEKGGNEARAKTLATEIENQLFNIYPDQKDYEDNARHLYTCLSGNKDNIFHLSRNLLSGALKPEKFAGYKREDLLTEDERKKVDEIAKAADGNTHTVKVPREPDGQFQCPKCKSWRTTHEPVQTRGGDEPMTNFCTCCDCGHSFRR